MNVSRQLPAAVDHVDKVAMGLSVILDGHAVILPNLCQFVLCAEQTDEIGG